MLYVQQSLGPDEELIHVGEYHWMYTVQSFSSILWGIAASLLMIVGSVFVYKHIGKFPANIPVFDAIPYLHPGVKIFSFLIFVMGILSFAQMMVVKSTTEIAITSSRLVYKRGLVARHVGEMSVDRIEGVNVLQSMWGRLFGYGRLAVRGMGVGEVVLPPIKDPLMFRQAIEKAKSSSNRRGQV